jgi:Tfp pilus assembly protein PilO
MNNKNIIVLLGIGTILLYYLLIRPLYNGVGNVWQPEHGIKTLMQMNAEYDEALAQASSLFGKADTLRKEYSEVSSEQKQKMNVMVPDSVDIVRLLSEVNSIGVEQGVPLINLSASEVGAAVEGKGTVGISFAVKTTYLQFKQLMEAFEKSMRLFSVQSVSFSSPEDGGATLYQVKLETYYLK